MKSSKIAAFAAVVMLSTPIAAQAASYTIVARVLSLSGTIKGGTINCTNNSGVCVASFTIPQTFQALPAPGYAVDKWSGCASNPAPDTCSVSGTASQAVYAYFKPASTPPPPPPTLIVRIDGGSGGVTQYSQTSGPISCYNNMGTCSLTPFTSKIILQAQPDAGYVVDKWVGCSPSADLTICDAGPGGANKAVDIYFKAAPPPVTHTLTLLVQGGSGAVNVGNVSCFSDDGGVTYTGTCSYDAPDASTLTLTASPTLGYVLDHWAGCSSVNPVDNSCTVVLTGDWSVGATFKVAPTPAPTPSGLPDDTNGSLPPP